MDQFKDGLRRERAYAAKRSRSGYLGRLTYVYSQLEQIMVDYKNVESAEKLKEDLNRTYQGFVDANKDFIENTDDDTELESAIQLYENQTRGKVEFDEYYKDWLAKLRHETTSNQDEKSLDGNLSQGKKSSAKSSSSGSHRSDKIKELKAKRTAATIKASHLKTFQEIQQQQLLLEQQRQILEVQNEIDQADAERKIWEENENDEDVAQRKFDLHKLDDDNPFTTGFNAVSHGLTPDKDVFSLPKMSLQQKFSQTTQVSYQTETKAELSAPSKFKVSRGVFSNPSQGQDQLKFETPIYYKPDVFNTTMKKPNVTHSPKDNPTVSSHESKEMSKLVKLQESMVDCQQRLISQQQENRGVKEYLPLLQKRQKWNEQNRNVAVNDLVLVEDAMLPRGQWQLGRITQVFADEKGFVRSADVKVKDTTLTRPITKLYLLELS